MYAEPSPPPEREAVKHLILLGDGMADWPLPDHDNRTPLELAKTPAMDEVARMGVLGQFCPIPEGLDAGSDVGNLSVFGYDPRGSFSGRAPLEAANQGIAVADDEVAFRCNLVTLEDGRMRDFTAGHISSPEAADLIAALDEALGDEFGAKFYPGVSYRHLVLLSATEDCGMAALQALACEPPHNITEQEWAPYAPKGEGAERINALMARSREVLAEHPTNVARCAAGKLPATSAWLWGQGGAPRMQTYADKFGLTGVVISAVDLVNGIGVCAGLEPIPVEGATGWIDTNYEGKINAALNALETKDFAYVHVEAPDEAGHQGDVALKVRAIEDFDEQIVAPALRYQESHPACRILVAPDHFTAIETRTHAGGPVPFAVCGPGIAASGRAAYSEREAEAAGICLDEGFQLTERWIREEALAF